MFLSPENIKKRWQEIKMEKQFDHGEDYFGIDYPPELQCPKVDKLVKALRSIEQESDYGKYDEYEDLKHRLDTINYDTYNLDSEAEGLRAAIEEARDWGTQWKHMAIQIIVKFNIDIDDL